MSKHILKIWPEYFKDIKSGIKTFEVRKDDRGYRVGDTLELLEYDPDMVMGSTQLDELLGFTGRSIEKEVVYKLNGGAFGIKEGYCILGIK